MHSRISEMALKTTAYLWSATDVVDLQCTDDQGLCHTTAVNVKVTYK